MSDGARQNSLERLTEDLLAVVAGDCRAADVFAALRSCPDALERATNEAVGMIAREPCARTVRTIVATTLALGWKAREALMETEELERMAR